MSLEYLSMHRSSIKLHLSKKFIATMFANAQDLVCLSISAYLQSLYLLCAILNCDFT